MSVKEVMESADSVLEALCGYHGVLRLKGNFKKTGNYVFGGDHTRKEDQAYTKWRPQISGAGFSSKVRKAGLNILGLDTTAQDDDGRYECRSKVLLRGFVEKEWVNTPVCFVGKEYTPSLFGKWRFPQISSELVDGYISLAKDFFLTRDHLAKAKDKERDIKKALYGGKGKWGGEGSSVKVSTPYDHWEINIPSLVEKPRMVWSAYPPDADGLKAIQGLITVLEDRITDLAKKLRDMARAPFLEVLPPQEQFRAIELGLLESSKLMGTPYEGSIVHCENFEDTYVPEEQAEDIVQKGVGEWSTYLSRGVEKRCVIAKQLECEDLSVLTA